MKNVQITVHYVTRQGNDIKCGFANRENAIARLTVLDHNERQTQLCAPTDSGDSRFCDMAEANAIRQALKP